MRLRGFGYSDLAASAAATVGARSRVIELPNQKAALLQLRDVVQPSVADPLVNEVALQLISPCPSRDDLCELEAIFHGVKYGNPEVRGFERGYKYVADPNWADKFTTPRKIIENLRAGINGGDCDEHTALICALGGSIGFTMGLLAYGPPGTEGFTHVLAVAQLPKRGGGKLVGMDTTVVESFLGWLPPGIASSKKSSGPSANVLVTWLQ